MNKKVICIWGSPGAGKSTLALAIAAYLDSKHRNTVIINTSITCPALPMFIPTLKTTSSSQSIGALLTAKTINQDALKGKLHLHPKSDRIAIMGLCSGETPITYKGFERIQILDLLSTLTNNSAFDFIIFDCESNPYYDQGTIVGMETADHIIRLITPDVKGIEFEKSQCKWLKNGNFQVDKHIRICSQVKENSPVDEIEGITGKFQYILPFASEVEDSFHSGILPKKFSMTTGILFDAEIEKLMEVILSE